MTGFDIRWDSDCRIQFFALEGDCRRGGVCGICIDPLDPEEIAEAIQSIVEHSAEAEYMGKNGRRAVEERYKKT